MNCISIIFGNCLSRDISYYADFRAEVFELLRNHLKMTTRNANGYYDHTEYKETERKYHLRHDSISACQNAPVFVKYSREGDKMTVVVRYDNPGLYEYDEPAAIIPVNQLHVFLNSKYPIGLPTGEDVEEVPDD